MPKEPSVQDVIEKYAGKVNEQKLRQVRQRLEIAFGGTLSDQPLDDPILIRRKLVAQLRIERASAGTIQALEQFFMGLVRRAAVDGLIPAPPEGPWTRPWQAVLASTERLRSHIRTLAAWATDQGLEPSEVDSSRLTEWADKAGCDSDSFTEIQSLLANFCKSSKARILKSASVLTERLRMKATRGSVRNVHE